MTSRRDFLKTGSVAAGAVALSGALRTADAAVPRVRTVATAPEMDAAVKELLRQLKP